MAGAVTNLKADESQYYWCISNRKKSNSVGYSNSRRNTIAEHLLTPSSPIPIKNNFDVLTNLTDDQTSVQDVSFAIHNDRLINRNRKFHRTTAQPLDNHVINHCTGKSRKMNYVRHELASDHEDTNIPKNIPTIINGCVSPASDEKFFYKHAKELYDKLKNAKNSIPKFRNFKILLIGDSHLRGYPEIMKSNLNKQFDISGFIKPGANVNIILNQITKETDNFTANDFIILCCGSNDTDNVKLNMVLKNFINFIKRVTWTNIILVTVPFRYDLKVFNTSLNKEITVFNKKPIKTWEVISTYFCG
jgi:hypothetical protein